MDMKMSAPIKVQIVIGVTDGEGQDAEITFTLGSPGQFPTEAQIRAAMAEAVGEMPERFRLQTKREFWDMICSERFGSRFAMPGSEEWDPTNADAHP